MKQKSMNGLPLLPIVHVTAEKPTKNIRKMTADNIASFEVKCQREIITVRFSVINNRKYFRYLSQDEVNNLSVTTVR